MDIKGEVKKPGVYEVDEESNVMDLINLAGGLTKNAYTANINLSKKLKSENVIIISNKKDVSKNSTVNCKHVGTTLNSNAHLSEIKNDAEVQSQELVNNNSQNDETAQNNSFDAETKLISINNASLEELQMIPGIGEAKALKILEYREENCFNSIEDIKNVSGIGDSLFEKIKDYISL